MNSSSKNKLNIRNEKDKSSKKETPKKTDSIENSKKQFEYNKMTLKEHVEKLPDTYIGSTEPKVTKEYIFDDLNQCIFSKEITINPGFCNIFDRKLGFRV